MGPTQASGSFPGSKPGILVVLHEVNLGCFIIVWLG